MNCCALTTLLLGLAFAPAALGFEQRPKASSFDAGRISRDPFARVDSVAASELISIDLGSDEAEEAQLAKFFRVTAYSIDRLAIALINGSAVAEGESFTVQTKSGKLRLRLLKVKQNGVVLKSSGTIFNVPLWRD